MANIQQTQTFYSLTLEAASATTSAVTCNAIPGLKQSDQQIFEARGEKIYLHRIVESEDRSSVTLTTVLEQNVFGIVRGVSAFRIPGTSTDQLVISSDSGRVSVLQYDAKANRFEKVKLETFGKSGVRRMIPGQYLASDGRGRCTMLASTEKNKVVYIYQRTAEGAITISSPHEANTWASLCFGVCALDTGWEHPVFASLEVDYSDAESDPTGAAYEAREKQLVYYTVDLGLNHVVRSWSDPVDYTANQLYAVPGGQDGPSGLLVCCEGRIYYKHNENNPLSIAIPRREGKTEDPNRKRIIVAGCLYLNRSKHDFWFLLQTEDGDVFKLSMEMEEDEQGRRTHQPARILLKYYDTLPVARQLLLIRKGYLYVAAENGNSKLYHVNNLADDLDFEPHNNFYSDDVSPDTAESIEPTYLRPRELTMLTIAHDVPSLHPLMRTRVDNLTGEDAPQIYALQGTGSNSVFKTIRHGLEVMEIVASPLGPLPHDRLWSLKNRESDEYHSLLLLSSSYGDRTIVLSIGDEVETVENTAFMTSRATILAAQMGEQTLIQVHARGVRSIYANGKINEWPSPQHTTILTASANQRQLLLGLSTGELCFFFMGDDGVLSELEERPEMSGKITSISVGQTPKGQMVSKYAVVGCDDDTIRVLSIELDSPLEPRSVQGLSAAPTSLEVMSMDDPGTGTTANYVHIGLESGLYLRATIDEVTGDLGEVRMKFLGPRAVKINQVTVAGHDGILACSSRPWLGYNHPTTGVYTQTPLVTAQMEYVANFQSEHMQCLCAIQGQDLLIFDLPRIDGRLTSDEVSLRYTPRSMTRHQEHAMFYVAQSEGNTLSPATKEELLKTNANGSEMEVDGQQRNGTALRKDSKTPYEIEVNADSDSTALEKHLGLPKGAGHWASCIQAIDPLNHLITNTFEFSDNESALCCTTVAFESKDWETYLAVGTGQHMSSGGLTPTASEPKGYVHIFKLLDSGTKLSWVHKTPVDYPVYAMTTFRGRLAVGIGPDLFVYDLGLKFLLRKTRASVAANLITSIQTMGNRLVCADVSESVTYVVYKPPSPQPPIPFVDDTIQRWTTATTLLDYETVAGGDKFGNLWVVRCPEQASKEADDEGVGGYIANERSYLNGAPYRLDLRAHIFTNDIPTSLQRTALVSGGQDVLFWSGLQGTLGILVPFVSREDVEFFSQLERLIREEEPPLSGRDHLMYRGYYVPVKGVVDGDLCERFLRLGYDSRQKIAAEVEREVKEVERKVMEMRGRVAF